MPKWLKWLLLAVLIGAIAGCFALLRMDPQAGVGCGLRVLIVVFALCGWFISQSLIAARGAESGEITDMIHVVSTPLHAYLTARPRVANAILIASSAFIDLFGIYLILTSVFGPSMRPFFALLMLFLLRQVCQMTCALPVPKGMIWRNPGFPSLLVTYGTSNDFFFSGHTAIAVLGAIEIAQVCPLWLGVAAGCVAALEAAVVLVLRAHYTMDIFGAIVAAFCVSQFSVYLWNFI